MTRRSLFALPAALVCLVFAGSTPSGQRPPSMSADLAAHPGSPHTHRVIVQAPEAGLAALRRGESGPVTRDLGEAVAIEVTDAQMEALQRNPLYSHVSGDLPVVADVAASNSPGAARTVGQGTSGVSSPGSAGQPGASLAVAILDSGIAPHTALDTRIVARINMVRDEPTVTGDPFGHGTLMAGIVAGDPTAAAGVTTAFAGGSAPAVRLVDVRVLGSRGTGRTSDVIAGIDWVVANRAVYDIRVINLSLGHRVTESSATDPLCRAVARAVAAGITVSVSAGNHGLTARGVPVLGGVTSPGNSPVALTVGATETSATPDEHDVVATYSSRGPARYDFAVKPDVVAPGTGVVSLEAPDSYLSTTYRTAHVAGSDANAYMRVTGTSAAAAVVSGGAALLLSAQPSLTPAQVKMAMQMGARFMPQAGLIAGGTGSVDFGRSLAIVQNGLKSATSAPGASSLATFRDNGSLIERIYGREGIRRSGVVDLGARFDNSDSLETGVLDLLGPSNPLGTTGANYLIWGDAADWSCSYYIPWGNAMESPSGQHAQWGTDEASDATTIARPSGPAARK